MNITLDRIPSPIGTILLISDGEVLCALDFEEYEARMHRLLRLQHGDCRLADGHAPKHARERIDRYFAGELAALDAIPVRLGGTEFQRQVWATLRTIPPGATTSYGAIAATMGVPKASRAVGAANGANSIALVVPCHRVIGADAGLTGYGGGLARKAWLLRHEAAR